MYGLRKLDHITSSMTTLIWGSISELTSKECSTITAAVASGQTCAYLGGLLVRTTYGKTRMVFYAVERPNVCAAKKRVKYR